MDKGSTGFSSARPQAALQGSDRTGLQGRRNYPKKTVAPARGFRVESKTWMAGTSPAMTWRECRLSPPLPGEDERLAGGERHADRMDRAARDAVADHRSVGNPLDGASPARADARIHACEACSGGIEDGVDEDGDVHADGRVGVGDDDRFALTQDAGEGEHAGREGRRAEGLAVARYGAEILASVAERRIARAHARDVAQR